jgi:hydroxymethylglutaryl-CoA synthase
MKVGINAFAFDFPKIYLPIPELAVARNIEPDKLTKGLGLLRMSFLDTHQDAVTMAANAVHKLMIKESLQPSQISRIYVGTESGVDNSKPIGSYIVSMLESIFGASSLAHIDVVDLTFACIGGIDAMQNCIDYIRLNPDETAIVVTTDFAKYDLMSTGEYTQGAGAIAMSIKSSPAILSFSDRSGISTQGVFDFFKPRRSFDKKTITGKSENEPWLDVLETEISIYKEQPIFDGQYSNQCYIDRISDAYQNYKLKNGLNYTAYQDWQMICMHLPYCFQARRTFLEIFAQENPELLQSQIGENVKDQMKALAKSTPYQDLVNEKIYPSEIVSAQIGNIYTGSIFLGLLSALNYSMEQHIDLTEKKCGFIAYGSGSKSKVFSGTFEQGWSNKIKSISLTSFLENCIAIDMDSYHKLHKKELKSSISNPVNEFVLDHIVNDNPLLNGARIYKYIS